MSALKDALKTSTSSKGSSSGRNPKYYNNQKSLFIQDMATSPDESTRVEVAGNEHVPAGTLKFMVENETSIDVLRVVLMNSRTPLKAIGKFIDENPLVSEFEDDDELTSYLASRANANSTSADFVDSDE